MFGGNFFGKPIPLNGGRPGGAMPVGQGQGGQVGAGPIGVVPQGRAQVSGAAAAPAAPPASFQQQPLIPPTKVPMGAKKDCPICRG